MAVFWFSEKYQINYREVKVQWWKEVLTIRINEVINFNVFLRSPQWPRLVYIRNNFGCLNISFYQFKWNFFNEQILWPAHSLLQKREILFPPLNFISSFGQKALEWAFLEWERNKLCCADYNTPRPSII